MEQEYVAAMQLGEREKEKFLASQADAIDEKTVTVLTEAADLAAGKEIYVANCQVCHGASGEGGVGPNFVDKYWIHGGSVGQIFSTIKYGVPEKGMIATKKLRRVILWKIRKQRQLLLYLIVQLLIQVQKNNRSGTAGYTEVVQSRTLMDDLRKVIQRDSSKNVRERLVCQQ